MSDYTQWAKAEADELWHCWETVPDPDVEALCGALIPETIPGEYNGLVTEAQSCGECLRIANEGP